MKQRFKSRYIKNVLRIVNYGLALWMCIGVSSTLPAAAQSHTATIDPVAKDASAGWAAYEAGGFEEARALMTRAAKIRPHNPDYQAALGLIDLKVGDRAAAIRHLQVAIQLKPSDAEYRLRLASVYQATNNDLDALQLLRTSTPDVAWQGAWHFTRGFSLFRLGRFDDAARDFTPLIANPNFTAPANFFLGNIAFSENRFADAARYFEQAVRLGDSDANVAYNAYTYNYGLALFRMSKYSEAEQQFKASVARYDRDPLPWMYIGRCEQELGNYKSAIAMLEKSIQIDPQFGLAYYELARLQQKYGDPERAAQLFDAIGRMKQEEIATEEKRAMKLKITESQQ